MLRFIPKQKEPAQIPPELAALPVPRRLLELLVERGIDTAAHRGIPASGQGAAA